jgi:tetratricopeptide (TPR) repeat protein
MNSEMTMTCDTPKPRRPLRWLPLVLLGLTLAGCSDDDDSSRAALGSSWSAFRAGDWQEAESGFLSAIGRDGSHAEAWLGLGWTRALRHADAGDHSDQREGVLDAFRRADRLQRDYADCWAGLAHYHSSQADTVAAVEWSLDALDLAGDNYRFVHREAVDGRSLRKIAAWNLLKLGRWDESLEQVRAVFAGWSPDAAAGDTLAQLLAKIGEL